MITIPNILMGLCLVFSCIIVFRKVKEAKQKNRKKAMKKNSQPVQTKSQSDYFDSIMDETFKS